MYNKFENLKKEVLKKFGLTSSRYLIASLIADIEITMTEDFNITFKSNEFLTDRQLNIINKYDKDYRKEERFEDAVNKIIEYYEEIITDIDTEYSKQIDDDFKYNEYSECGKDLTEIFKRISIDYEFYNDLVNEFEDPGFQRFNSIKDIFNSINLMQYKVYCDEIDLNSEFDRRAVNCFQKLVIDGSCYLNELLELYAYRHYKDKYEFLSYIKNMYNTEI